MSVAVLGYQAAIAAIIIGAAIMSGRKACIVAVVLASIWTLTHIFVLWLMVLQFVTVAVAAFIGLSIAPKSNSEALPEPQPQPEPIQFTESSKTDASGAWVALIIIGVIVASIVLSQNNDGPSSKSTQIKPATPARVVKPQAPVARTYSEQREAVPQTPRNQDSRFVNQNPGQRIKSPGYNTTKEVQQLLAHLGYNPGPADGVFGAATRGAVSQFQRDIGQYPDGFMSVALLEELRTRAR